MTSFSGRAVTLLIYLASTRIVSVVLANVFIWVSWIKGFFLIKLCIPSSDSTWLYRWRKVIGSNYPIWRKSFASVFRMSRRIRELRCQGLYTTVAIACFLTTRCTRNCKGCPKKTNSDEMTDEQWEAIVLDGAANGVLLFAFLGGEPMIRKKLIKELKKKVGFKVTFLVFTNGDLVTEQDIIDFNRLGIMLAFNVGSRRKDDTKTLQAMVWAKKHHAFTGVSITLTQENYLEVASEDYLQWLMEEYGISFTVHFHYSPIGHEDDQRYILSEEAYWAAEKLLSQMTLPIRVFQYSRCHTLREITFIEADGRVVLCAFCRGDNSLGDAREDSVLDIINNAQARKYRAMNPGRCCMLTNFSNELLTDGHISFSQFEDLQNLSYPQGYIRPVPLNLSRKARQLVLGVTKDPESVVQL